MVTAVVAGGATRPFADATRDIVGFPMPFADESQIVELTRWRPEWQAEFDALAHELHAALGHVAVAIDHVGSTAVPGMPAKDVIDAQVLVLDVDDIRIADAFAGCEFRRRPEPWNQVDVIGCEEFPKAVYAPPRGARAVNVHVRAQDGESARYALLFRDFLRADADARDAWAALKSCIASHVDDLAPYGQIKGAALPLLMRGAERWAVETAWTPRHAGTSYAVPPGGRRG
jgi:GrpB-like predicted nucleotidyltransferase (UPF0157 family)